MITAEFRWFLELAAADSFQHMGRQFQRNAGTWQLSHFLLLVVVVALASVGVWLLSRYLRYRDGIGYDNPKALFVELCRTHGLDRPSQRLLAQLAKSLGLKSPAQLFVEPHHFETAPGDGPIRQRMKEVQSLRDRVFGRDWCEATLGAGHGSAVEKELPTAQP